MIPKECKRLAEVDFPVTAVSNHSARDKYIRYKPTTSLHTWWAQRPLAACRAILLALLLPDPVDPRCPSKFKEKAREILASLPTGLTPDDYGLRKALLKFIGDFASWDLLSNSIYLEASRSLIKAADNNEVPLVVDPFAGGGSIPLEALRLGCDTFASDINPVSFLMLKSILEDIPRSSDDLEEDLRDFGSEVKNIAEKELAAVYPEDSDGRRPIAYLWARTVRCEAPECGAEIPLVRSFWLCKKRNKWRALRYLVIRKNREVPKVDFEVFSPETEKAVPKANINRAKARCLCCGSVLSPDRVRAQLSEQHGGVDVMFDDSGKRVGGARLLAVVTVYPGDIDRQYRSARKDDYRALWKAKILLEDEIAGSLPNDIGFLPDEPIGRVPVPFGVINVWVYGVNSYSDLFTVRQKLTISTLIRVLRERKERNDVVTKLLAFVVNKFARHCNGNARWNNIVESVEPAFGMQSLPFTWTFPESVPWGRWAENYDGSLDAVINCLKKGFVGIRDTASVEMADAVKSPLPDACADVWFTDPPYYDNVPYSYLSDFFYVWLKRTLGERYPALFRTTLTPKSSEIVAYLQGDHDAQAAKSRYEEKLTIAFIEGRRTLRDNGVGCVVFAHKTTEGWEALLSGIIRGGWVITASWPISTERAGRLRARESAALEASIHLICRPRAEDTPVGDWHNVIRELPKRVRIWMERLQAEGIRGADLVFASIGPALEIYSQYSKVVDAEDREVPLGGDPFVSEPHNRGYLTYVWEAVGRAALEQVLGTAEAKSRNSAAGALEEDARLTALFLWTLQGTNGNGAKVNDKDIVEEIDEDEEGLTPQRKRGGFNLVFDIVRRFAQPLGIILPDWEGRIIETKKGVVRLLPVKERAKQLFGDTGTHAVADQLEKNPARAVQLRLFSVEAEGTIPKIKGRGGKRSKRVGVDVSEDDLRARREATTLDRVHAAMLLQASGRANALRALLKAEVERGPDFLRLANALSALYPKVCEEKRLLDAMLLAVPK